MLASSGMNFASWLTIPLNRWSSFTLVGRGNSRTALVFSGSASTPLSEIPEHHSVGTVTGEITLSCTMRSNFSFTLGRSGCGTRRGVYKYTGTASCLSGIRYSCPISPRPLKSLGYYALKSGTFSTLCTSAAGVSSRSACIACFDRRLLAWLDMTYTFSLWLLPAAWRVALVI